MLTWASAMGSDVSLFRIRRLIIFLGSTVQTVVVVVVVVVVEVVGVVGVVQSVPLHTTEFQSNVVSGTVVGCVVVVTRGLMYSPHVDSQPKSP